MRVIILCGIPGSGKSLYRDQLGLKYVNQDQLGNANKCAEWVNHYLSKGEDVVIDRTNIDKYQRRKWITLAKSHKVEKIECHYFIADPEKCIKRIQKRISHETIPNNTPLQKIRKIVYSFYRNLEEPKYDEGFDSIKFIYTDPISRKTYTRNERGHWHFFKSLLNFFTRKRTL